MLEFYLENQAKLCQLRQCPVGNYLDDFAQWLQSSGYKQRPAQLTLRAAAHLGHWLSEHGAPIECADDELIDSFIHHLPACACSHAFRGGDRYHAVGARCFLNDLRTIGIIPPLIVAPVPVAPLANRFRDWMRQHRGVTEGTLANYLPLVQEFLAALGDDPTTYDARQVRDFILAVSHRHGEARTRSTVNAVRMFLRFLAAYGYCSPDLVAAVPGIARWRLASLPRYIGAADVERLIATCDPGCATGARDRAIILLLARLGLRAGDVRDLLLGDIDWSQGRLRVMGKGRCESWLPLPQEVGDAVWHYLEHFRPRIDDAHVFLRVYAPLGPLPSSGPISKLVRRAIQRAGIQAPSMGAHVLRHSAATAMLREGVSLDIIGAVLRHRCMESTAQYAKVDTALLQAVTQPWPIKEGALPC
jgi:site-specific recombinase XerD